MPCAFCMPAMTAFLGAMRLMAVCIVALGLPPSALAAPEMVRFDSPAWCARHAPAAQQAQCLQYENACRAALPEMTSAGGCPSREFEACVARQEAGASSCSLLCCFDPDDPACRAAANAMPQIFAPPER